MLKKGEEFTKRKEILYHGALTVWLSQWYQIADQGPFQCHPKLMTIIIISIIRNWTPKQAA